MNNYIRQKSNDFFIKTLMSAKQPVSYTKEPYKMWILVFYETLEEGAHSARKWRELYIF